MEKLIVKSVLFSAILIGGLIYLSSLSKYPSHFQNTMTGCEEILKESKAIDIAIYGSSHAYCSYDPLILDSITQTRSFNFGNDSQRFITTNFVIKETLKEISPKLAIIDFYSATIKMPVTEEQLFFQKKTYDHFPMSWNKMKYLLELDRSGSLMTSLFPILDRKDFAVEWLRNKDFQYPANANATEYRGFVGFDLFLHQAAKEKTNFYINDSPWKKEISTEDYDDFLDENELNSIVEMVCDLRSDGVEPLFTVSPYFGALANPNYLSLHKFYQELTDKLGADLLDFNLLVDEMGIEADDFKDAQHLNTRGAQKVSNYLGKYINENYQLPSRKNELAWIKEQPKSLQEYISFDFSQKSLLVNKKLSSEIQIKSIGFYKERTSKKCILELQNGVADSTVDRYKLGFHTYVFDSDKKRLTGYAKTKNRDYDAWDFNPQLTRLNGKTYIIKKITTPINEFRKIRLFLYDRDGYNGIIGNAIETDEIHLK